MSKFITSDTHKFTEHELNEGQLFYFEPGNGTRMKVFIKRHDGDLLVGCHKECAGSGLYHFNTPVHGSYVAEKLGLMTGDADHLAYLINTQLTA